MKKVLSAAFGDKHNVVECSDQGFARMISYN